VAESLRGLTVNSAVRGTALALVLVAALTACGGGSGSGTASRENGDSLEGHEDNAPVGLTAEQVRTALPSSVSHPEGWGGGSSAKVEVGEEAAKTCGYETGTACSGLTAAGKETIEGPQTVEAIKNGRDPESVYIKVFSFDTVDNAGVAMKSAVAIEHKEATKYGDKPDSENLAAKVSAGAEDTHVFSDTRGTDTFTATVLMRTGTVVVKLWGIDLKKTDIMAVLAKLQIDRINKVAEGKNPDA
jgi:hypothetical protein